MAGLSCRFRSAVAVLLAIAAGDAAPAGAELKLRSRRIAVPTAGHAERPAPALDQRYLLALAQPVTASMRAELGDAGARVEAYVPDHGLLVAIPAPALAAVLAKPWIRAIWPLEVGDRISPRLLVPDPAREPDPEGLLTVALAPGSDPASLAATLTATDAAIAPGELRRGGTWPRLVVRVRPGSELESARRLAALPGVVWIEPAGQVRFLNDSSVWVGQSWDTAGFATPLFARGLHGAGQIVGVADTGLDADHGSFYDPVAGLPGPLLNLAQRKVIAYHDRLQDGNWDSNGHGTHTAGTIAGDLDGDGLWDANGAAQAPDGMAPAARLAISDADDTCLPGNPIDLRELFAETYADGARLHSNSWASCDCNEYTVHAQDVDDFLWANRDMAIFFAAGNAGPGPATVLSPGTAKGCVTVGATERAAGADVLAGFSGRGPSDDGRLKPTLTAPGVGIRSAAGDGNVTSFNDGVSALSGTSMATPTAAGLGTLVRQYLTDGWYPSGVATPADARARPSAALLKALLINSARSMASETVAPANGQGWGRVLLDDVLYFAGDSRRLWLEDEQRGLSSPGETRRFGIRVGSGVEALKVTLVWTDPPAATLVGPKLVNDLDLAIDGPDGSFLGNNFAGGESQIGGSPDRVNVEEGLRLGAPSPGLWTVSVTAANVPWGPQPFALVVTGDVAPAARIGYASHLASDPDGDGDGAWEPGELGSLDLSIAEGGGASASGVVVRLVALAPWARVLDPDTKAFPDIVAGGLSSSASPWRIALEPDAPCGERLPLRIDIDSDAGAFSDHFTVALGGARITTTTLLSDAFDGLANGDPPDLALWRTGFAVPPVPAVGLRVEADATVEPSGSAPSSLPHALYIGRSSGTSDPSRTVLDTQAQDLGAFDRARLSFRYWVRNLEGGTATADRLLVRASSDAGLSFPTLLYTNPDYASGMDSSLYPDRRWHEVVLDLGRAGLLVPDLVLRFEVEVNGDEPADAVYLDDVRLEGDQVSCDPGCIEPAFDVVSGGAVCVGTPSLLRGRLFAPGYGSFAFGWDHGDASSQPVASPEQAVAHLYAAPGSYLATLEAIAQGDPGCRRSESLWVEVDALPVVTPDPVAPICASDPNVVLTAREIASGRGPIEYHWDFGDGSPPLAVAGAATPAPHLYPAAPGQWTATLRSSAARVPGCFSDATVPIEVVAAILPAGAVGNGLRAVIEGSGIRLDWTRAPLAPRRYNVHRSADKRRLVETLAILGGEPVVGSPDDAEIWSDLPGAGGLWLYEVVGREACSGVSHLP